MDSIMTDEEEILMKFISWYKFICIVSRSLYLTFYYGAFDIFDI